MKKIKTIIIISLAIIVILIPKNVNASYKKGDINNNGKIDVVDVLLMLKHISANGTGKHKEWILTGEKFEAANVIDNDNKIANNDILAILRYIAAEKDEKSPPKYRKNLATAHPEWLTRIRGTNQGIQPTPIDQNVKIKDMKFLKTEISLDRGKKQNLLELLNIEPNNANRDIIWKSKNTDIATVSSTGVVTAIKAGTATIEVKDQITNKSRTIRINATETNNIYFDNADIVLDMRDSKAEKTIQLQLSGNNVDKKSIEYKLPENKNIIEVKNYKDDRVTIRAINPGVETLTATVNGKTAEKKIYVVRSVKTLELNKTEIASMEKGSITLLKATLIPSNASEKEIEWVSSNPNVAKVDKKTGVVTAVGKGTAIITATSKTITNKTVSAKCSITVPKTIITIIAENGQNITDKTLTVNRGDKINIDSKITGIKDKNLLWKTSNSKLVNVDLLNKKGFTIKILNEGTGEKRNEQITVISKGDNTIKAQIGITINETKIDVSGVNTIKLGNKQTLKATIEGIENKSLVWSSSNTNIATVSQNGIVTSKKVGSTIITVKSSVNEKIKRTFKITVKDPKVNKIIPINKTIKLAVRVADTSSKTKKLNLKYGKKLNSLVTFSPIDADNKEMTWKVKNEKVAKLGNGKIYAVELGSTELIGTLKSNPKIKVTIKVVVEHTADAKNKIEKATSWMEKIAKSPAHGYNLGDDDRYGQNGDYSCSGLNIMGWKYAGVDARSKGAAVVYNEREIKIYKSLGFKDVTKLVNLNTKKGLRRGDVLLYDGHVSQYCGKGKMVEALADEHNGITGGTPGDQTGKEIDISYYRTGAFKVLRYYGK